jgi:DNA-binding transcriptional LysR family regulator
MDTLVNVRTFLTVVRLGNFAAAARAMSVAPSVISKRIGQLEHEFGITLFHRSTRQVLLTVDGSRLMPRCQKLLTDYDELREFEPRNEIHGHLRIDAPGTVTSRIFGPIFSDFLAKYPSLDMDLRLVDRLDSQVTQDCDLVIGTRPSTSDQIVDFPLMPYTNATYASYEYLQKHGEPQHPRELVDHRCLASLLYGTVWHFYSDTGDFAVTVVPRFQVNDTLILREAVRRHLGIAVLPTTLVENDIESGLLKQLLPDFRPPPLWLKALVPMQKLSKPSVTALLEFLHERLTVEPAYKSGQDKLLLHRNGSAKAAGWFQPQA